MTPEFQDYITTIFNAHILAPSHTGLRDVAPPQGSQWIDFRIVESDNRRTG